jgi:hypothetical protein
MYRCKMEKQTSSVKNVKMLTLPKLSDDNKKLLPLPQVQAYNWLTPDKSMPTPDRSTPMPDRSMPTPYKSMPTPGNKHLWHQLHRNSDAKMTHLMPTDCVRETSSGTSTATVSKFTTHRKLTWVPLLPLSITSKIPQ